MTATLITEADWTEMEQLIDLNAQLRMREERRARVAESVSRIHEVADSDAAVIVSMAEDRWRKC